MSVRGWMATSIVAAAGLTYGSATTPAGAAECYKRTDLINQLSSKFAELPVSYGVAANGKIIEIFASAITATFTILVTEPDGTTCVLATGESWESAKPKAAKPDF